MSLRLGVVRCGHIYACCIARPSIATASSLHWTLCSVANCFEPCNESIVRLHGLLHHVIGGVICIHADALKQLQPDLLQRIAFCKSASWWFDCGNQATCYVDVTIWMGLSELLYRLNAVDFEISFERLEELGAE